MTTERKPATEEGKKVLALKNGQADSLRADLAVLFQGPTMVDRLNRALDREKRNTVKLVLEAHQEHLACACDGIEGHLRTRGLTSK